MATTKRKTSPNAKAAAAHAKPKQSETSKREPAGMTRAVKPAPMRRYISG